MGDLLSRPAAARPRLRELLARPEPLVAPRRLRRAVGPAGRAGGVRRRLHDGVRHHGVAGRPSRRRAAHRHRDGRQRASDRGRRRRAGDRRRGHRLRQRDQRRPHGAGLRAGRGGRDPPRGPGDAQEVRPHERQGGDPGRRDGGQDPRGRRGAARPGFPADRPHRRGRRRGPVRRDRPGAGLRRRGRRRAVRRGADQRGRHRQGGRRSCAGWRRWCSTGPRAAAPRRSRWPASRSWASRWCCSRSARCWPPRPGSGGCSPPSATTACPRVDGLPTFDGFTDLIGLPEIRELEARFGTP